MCSRARSTFQSALRLARLSPHSDEKEATIKQIMNALVRETTQDQCEGGIQLARETVFTQEKWSGEPTWGSTHDD